MDSIFDKEVREKVISRVNLLGDHNSAQWGKMTLYQMLRHCILWEDMVQGKTLYKRAFIGLLFGKMALRKVMADDAPLQRNTPTLPELTIKERDGDIGEQKRAWISRIEGYANFSNVDFIHPFFGSMTREQIGFMVYKHIDHHLRQFNG